MTSKQSLAGSNAIVVSFVVVTGQLSRTSNVVIMHLGDREETSTQ